MAPQRVLPQDNRSESSKERQATTSSTLKARRTASSLVTANSNLANVTAAPTVAEAAAQQSNADAHGINWATFKTSELHAYRHAYRLQTPSAFSSAHNQAVLQGPGLGRYSPTMARQKDKRRVGKEHLAMAVRRDFNAAGVSEQEVVTAFLYTVRHLDKHFKAKFVPAKSK